MEVQQAVKIPLHLLPVSKAAWKELKANTQRGEGGKKDKFYFGLMEVRASIVLLNPTPKMGSTSPEDIF